jgi:hypothetical protein
MAKELTMRWTITRLPLIACTLIVLTAADTIAAAAAASGIPIQEVTIFKDGHAFVLHEGATATNQQGEVVLEQLPTPVIGTFWAYSADSRASLDSVVSGRRLVTVARTPLTQAELVKANVGARVLITDAYDQEYQARILGVPVRTSEELAVTGEPGSPPRPAEHGQMVLLEVAEGTRVIDIDSIERWTFLDPPTGKVEQQEMRSLMRLRLDWGGRPARKSADVGMVYLQKGIRWIPSYRVEIDGDGSANLRLQATLINELDDLQGVTAHLVVGVPSFVFADTPDPISMQETMVRLSSSFQRESQTAFAFSNAIMTQQIAMPSSRVQPDLEAPTIDLGPDIAASGKHEDLYVFTIDDITLARGERMVVQVAELTLPYQDVFKLELPFTPPPEVRSRFNTDQQEQLARLLSTPKVKHVLRLRNSSEQPLTTAPALILQNNRLLAQGMITYTASGGVSDLEITTAVDVSVRRSDREVKRTPDATRWHGTTLDRIDLEGNVLLVNHRRQPIDLEVQRQVLGHVDAVGQDGTIEQTSLNEGWFAPAPWWWSWYSWPYWWYRMNPVSRIEWQLTLEPGEQVELTYVWHYFWD